MKLQLYNIMLHNKIDPETFAKDIPPTYVQKKFKLEDLKNLSKRPKEFCKKNKNLDKKGDPNVYDQEGDMEIENIGNIEQNCDGDYMASDEVMREEILLLEDSIEDSVGELILSNNRT